MIPHVKGRVARQAHVDVPAGTCEEEYARDGFSGAYAHLYRKAPPVAWSRIEGPLRPRAYDLAEGPAPRDGDLLAALRPCLANDDVRIAFARLAAPMPYLFRDADGDTLLFVHAGAGTLETDFGPLAYRRGDYLLVPRGTSWRLAPSEGVESLGPSMAPRRGFRGVREEGVYSVPDRRAEPPGTTRASQATGERLNTLSDVTALLVVTTRGALGLPERGLLGQHALFDPAVIDVPTPPTDGAGSTLAPNADGEWELVIRRRDALTRVFYPHCPLDTVGWKGTLSPQRLNVADIRPVMSERYHLPPSAHATFVADGVIICTFLPRALEDGDAGAMKVPFFHNNIDYDEVLFYHDGDFFSRTGVRPGMLTFHPQGIHHGPQPGAAERARDAARTEEVAVMIDTRRPLDALPAAAAVEVTDYWKSWGARP